MGFIGKQPAKAAITSSDITDGVVTAAKLASDSVTTAKIADNGVTTAKINADAVTDAKIADDVVGSEHLTAGEVDTTALGADAVTAAKIADDAISDEHLDPTAITGQTAETSAADDDLILLSDTSASAALKKMTRSNFLSGVGGANTPAFCARVESDQSVSHNTETKLAFADEVFDTDGTYDHSTNYRWTPGVTGKFVIGFGGWIYDSDDSLTSAVYKIKKNGSDHAYFQSRLYASTAQWQRFWLTGILPIDVTSTSDYYEIFLETNTVDAGAVNFNAASANFRNYFYGYKFIT